MHDQGVPGGDPLTATTQTPGFFVIRAEQGPFGEA